MQLDPVIDLLLRSVFFALFASALAHKLWSFGTFEPTVAAYLRGTRWATPAVTRVLAIAVILGEALVVLACVAPVEGVLRASAASAILLAYGAAMGANLARGNVMLDCGCSWGDRQPVGRSLVWRNVVLALVACAMALPAGTRELGVIDFVTVIAGLVVSAILYLGFNQLIAAPDRMKEAQP